MKIGIAFTMKNLLHFTQQAYDSIQTTLPYHLIMISDWSSDGTNEWLTELQQRDAALSVDLEPLTDSLAGKWNIAAEFAWENGCEAVLICNNDIIFHPATIDALAARLEKGGADMVTAHNVRTYVAPEELAELILPEFPSEAPHPDFSCFLLSKHVWDAVGRFDESFVPCYFEDNDYHYRMQKAGLTAISTTAAPYYHYGSQTQNSIPGGLCPGPQFLQNRNYFVKKHGVDPSTYQPLWD